MQSGGDEMLPPGTVLAFLGETLAEVARRIEGVEAHAAGAVAGTGLQDRTRVMALQELDLIRQMVEDSARIALLAQGEGGRSRPDLAAALRLSALRDRLPVQGASAAAAPPLGSTQAHGRVELFAGEGASGEP